MAVRPLNHLSLCDGYGGWSRTWRHLNAPVRTVCRVEWEAHAAATLVARMADQTLDQAPIWDDLNTFDGRPWCGRVDVITAGFPCIDFSTAGRRDGVDGEHWLWPEVFRITCEVGPSIVVVENVPGLVRLGGLTRVLGDLASVGFDAEWGLYAAADVGAPHGRERVWLVAYRDLNRLKGLRRQPDHDWDPRGDVDGCRCADGEDVGDTARKGPQGHRVGHQEPSGRSVADRPGVWPPHRDDHEGWATWIADGGPEPGVRRDAHGPTYWLEQSSSPAHRLHLLGNGHVPQCAAEAVSQLIERTVTA